MCYVVVAGGGGSGVGGLYSININNVHIYIVMPN